MVRRIAVDSNLLTLWVIGTVAPHQIGRHRRVRAYTSDDFSLLLYHVEGARIVFTPNVLTEVSNLTRQEFERRLGGEISSLIRNISAQSTEIYVKSSQATNVREFNWLGLTDTSLLELKDDQIELFTADAGLYDAAIRRGLIATNFNHLREHFGTL